MTRTFLLAESPFFIHKNASRLIKWKQNRHSIISEVRLHVAVILRTVTDMTIHISLYVKITEDSNKC